MVHKVDESCDASNIVELLIENVINEAFKTIIERSDPNSYSFETPKSQNQDSDEIESIEMNEEIFGQPNETNAKNAERVNSCWSDLCYQSLPNLREVCMKSSSLSNSSKQGEGDQHPQIKEATAFYRLETDTNKNPLDKGQKMSSNSSINSNSSYNEIIQCLQNEIYNLSLDSVRLSDSEIGDRERISSPSKSLSDEILRSSHVDCKNESDCCDDELKLKINHNQNYRPVYLQSQDILPQSQKFCQYNNVQYFPFNILPENYCQLVDESYDKYQAVDDEEAQKLLSDSSEELVIIDGEEEEIPFQDYVGSHPYSDSVEQCSVMTSHQSPRPSTSRVIDCCEEVKTNAEPTRRLSNWEENLEVQVKVIEPSDVLKEEDKENEDLIQTRQYWSNVGLMQEKTIDRKYLGPTDQLEGIENTQGVKFVEEKCLRKSSDELLWTSEPRNLEAANSQPIRPKSASEGNEFSYLSIRKKEENEKKKRKLISRLASSFANIFRSKNKSIQKHL